MYHVLYLTLHASKYVTNPSNGHIGVFNNFRRPVVTVVDRMLSNRIISNKRIYGQSPAQKLFTLCPPFQKTNYKRCFTIIHTCIRELCSSRIHCVPDMFLCVYLPASPCSWRSTPLWEPTQNFFQLHLVMQSLLYWYRADSYRLSSLRQRSAHQRRF